jgi:hypothetical protein
MSHKSNGKWKVAFQVSAMASFLLFILVVIVIAIIFPIPVPIWELGKGPEGPQYLGFVDSFFRYLLLFPLLAFVIPVLAVTIRLNAFIFGTAEKILEFLDKKFDKS